MKIKMLNICSIILALATLIISGCASTSGGYPLKLTHNDVSWVMTRYHNRVPSGLITPSEQQRVNTAYQAYLQAYNEAVQQANSNLDTPTPANVKQLANQLLSTLDSL